MIERVVLVVRGWASSWKVWLAFLALAIDVVIQTVGRDGLLFAPLFQYVATLLLVSNTRGLLHTHVLGPGRALLPGIRRTHLLLTGSVVSVLLLPTIVISSQRDPFGSTALVTVPLGILLGTTIASVKRSSVRGFLIGLSGGSLGPITAWVDDASPDAAPIALLADPYAAAIIGAGALALTVGLLAVALRGEEVPSVFRGAGGASKEACDGDDSWLASALPLLGRRPMARQTRATLPTWIEASALWQRAGGAMQPLALGLLLGGLMNALTFEDVRTEGAADAIPMVYMFALLACASIGVGYTCGRLHMESMRPVVRDDMLRAFARAYALDVVQYAVTVVAMTLVVHALADPAALSQPEYWLLYLPLPGTIAVGIVASWLGLRWTRYGGFAGFLLAGCVGGIAVALVGRHGSAWHLPLAALVAFGLAAALVRVARHSWRDFEPGR